jgi:hypothetical protein
MNNETTIAELTHFIAERYTFTPEKYPELARIDDASKRAFAIRHLGIHFAKTAGKIAAVSEAADHGSPLDEESLRTDIAKSLLTTLGGLARKKREDLLELEGIGEKGITEIKKVLNKFGLNLKD